MGLKGECPNKLAKAVGLAMGNTPSLGSVVITDPSSNVLIDRRQQQWEKPKLPLQAVSTPTDVLTVSRIKKS
jgi:hypothetical protein